MNNKNQSLLNFIHFAERLKNENRNGRTSSGKQDSVADHTWRVSLMVLVFSSFLDQKISLEKALKIALVHDLAEAVTGDKPYFFYEGRKDLEEEKVTQELKAMEYIKDLLPEVVGAELLDLWTEYETGETYEAQFVKAVDKIEAQIQHNEMDYIHWNDFDRKHASTRLDRYCKFDSFLTKIKTLVQKESMSKIANSQIN